MFRSLSRMITGHDAARRYWARRFGAAEGHWTAAGDRDLSEEQNRRSHDEIQGHICRVLQRWAAPCHGKTLLDAGCGWGHFTEACRHLGFEVTGVDFCAAAIRHATRQYPACRFEVMDLADPRLGECYDVILAVNTLVAIAADDSWQSAVEGLARQLTPAGALLIFERLRGDRDEPGPAHVRFRSLDDYQRALDREGLQVHHHESIALEVEGRTKDLIFATRR